MWFRWLNWRNVVFGLYCIISLHWCSTHHFCAVIMALSYNYMFNMYGIYNPQLVRFSFIHTFIPPSPYMILRLTMPILAISLFLYFNAISLVDVTIPRSYKIFNISPFWYYMYYMLDLWLDNIYLDKQDLQFIFYLIFWYFFLGIFC